MKTSIIILLLILSSVTSHAQTDSPSHFRRAEIPINERRLSELAGVHEFRCDYELTKFNEEALLIAEVYDRDGKLLHRFRLSRQYFEKTKTILKGLISIGWQRNLHNLVSFINDGDDYTASTSIHLEDFSAMDAFYFENSFLEKRKSEDKGSPDSELYPVMGICGERQLQMGFDGKSDKANGESFLQACWRSGAKQAVVIYLYTSDSGGDPSLKFDKPGN